MSIESLVGESERLVELLDPIVEDIADIRLQGIADSAWLPPQRGQDRHGPPPWHSQVAGASRSSSVMSKNLPMTPLICWPCALAGPRVQILATPRAAR